jgi:hypothetical protein
MADNRTALDVLHEIVGSTEAQTIVPALEQLNGMIGGEALDEYVYAWLDQHGATVGYEVTDGNLTITIA